jgi:hypothetical protein
MNANQIHGTRTAGVIDCGLRHATGYREPELRIDLARGNVFMRVRLDSRSDTDQDSRCVRPALYETLDAIELIEVVHDDPTHTGLEAHRELFDGLVVAMKDQPIGRHSRSESDGQFAPRRNIDSHACGVDEASNRPTQERLRGVDGAIAEGGHRLLRPSAQMGFVVDE